MLLKDIIRERRYQLNLTLEDISKAVGVSHTTVQRWESGEIEDMKSSKIKLLANVLQVSPGYLMGWTEDPNENNSKMDSEIEAILERLRKDEAYRAMLSSSVDIKKEHIGVVKGIIDTINGQDDDKDSIWRKSK